ncbi:MAG: radical SAM-associated putative lipoprotein [Bacteroidota bacterium]|nr:radical SAM-associated putative lipoprotein [Bacteroidota bacterium]
MKKKAQKSINKLLGYFIAILGIGGACTIGACEYGSPHATFIIQGRVTSETHERISNIQINGNGNTSYTDSQGSFLLQIEEFPHDQEFLLKFRDIDEELNGSYQALDTIVKFTDPEFVNPGDHWYSGETLKEFNVSLKKED